MPNLPAVPPNSKPAKLPYVDCFAAALALLRKAPLITSDSDFTNIAKQLPIVWAT